MTRLRNTGLALFGLLAASGAAAQQPASPEVVGGIVAVVGDSVILDIEINEQLQLIEQQCQARKAQGQPCAAEVKWDDAAALRELKKEIIESRVMNLVLLIAAQRDTTIQLDDNTLNAQVESEVQRRKAAVGGPVQFEQALRAQRMTEMEFRNQLASELRKRFLVEQYVGKVRRERKPASISESELQKLFEEQKRAGLLPSMPASISFTQVVLAPRASDEARAKARAEADSLLRVLFEGKEKFETLAERHSDDTGTRANGGDLGWARSGRYVGPFNSAVFGMRIGQISPVIETVFGYHIIKLEKIRGAERQARHILIQPEITAEDAQRNFERAEQIAEQIRAGADVDSIAKAVGDPDSDTRVGPIARDRLNEASPVHAQILANARTGDVVGPFNLGNNVAVAKVTEVREAGVIESLDDQRFKDAFKQEIQNQRLIDEVIVELKKKMYIEVRLD